jgi:hypothetical protein
MATTSRDRSLDNHHIRCAHDPLALPSTIFSEPASSEDHGPTGKEQASSIVEPIASSEALLKESLSTDFALAISA